MGKNENYSAIDSNVSEQTLALLSIDSSSRQSGCKARQLAHSLKMNEKKIIILLSWLMLSSHFVSALLHFSGMLSSSSEKWPSIHFKHTRPVNLHPLFLFWKHGSVCDPENKSGPKKSWVQKNRVVVIQKEKRQSGLFSFWITMTRFFCTLLFFGPGFFSSSRP